MSCVSRIAALSFAAAGALVAALSAQAQSLPPNQSASGSGGGTLNLAGEAPQGCVLSLPTQTGIVNATLTAGAGAAEIRVTELVDPQTGVPIPSTIDMEFAVVCNGAHRIVVRTLQGGLVPEVPGPPPGPGLRDELGYRVSAVWAGQQAAGASESMVPVDIAVSDAAAGVLALQIAIPGGGAPLVAGVYYDSLVVELQPAN